MSVPDPALRLTRVVSTGRGLSAHRARSAPPDDRRVLDGIDLTVRAGSAVLILGPSGGGKTTLLRLAARLVDPDSGTVEVLGRDASGWDPGALRRAAVFVPQHPVALAGTVRGDLAAPLAWAGRPVEDAPLRAALGSVGLGSVDLDAAPDTLSGGQRARLTLARALLLEPRVLLLDEPTGSLDVQSARELLACLDRWRAEHGGTIVAITHRPEDATHLGDAVYVLLDGRLRGPFDPAAIAERRADDPEVQAFLGRPSKEPS